MQYKYPVKILKWNFQVSLHNLNLYFSHHFLLLFTTFLHKYLYLPFYWSIHHWCLSHTTSGTNLCIIYHFIFRGYLSTFILHSDGWIGCVWGGVVTWGSVSSQGCFELGRISQPTFQLVDNLYNLFHSGYFLVHYHNS